MPKKKVKRATRVRSAKSGRFAPKAAAKRSPATTLTEAVETRVRVANALVGPFAFDVALRALRDGLIVRRAVWHAQVHLKMPYSTSILMTNGLIGHTRVWPVNLHDILCEDWMVAS